MMIRVLTLSLLVLASLGCSKKDSLPETLKGALLETFSSSVNEEWLMSEFELDEMWSASHPDYDSEIRVLLTSVPVESMSPNYRVAFYQRKGDVFVKIDRVFEFGGYKRPELGRHPELDVPAIVAEMEPIAEKAYFLVHDGKIDSFHENEDNWTTIKKRGEK